LLIVGLTQTPVPVGHAADDAVVGTWKLVSVSATSASGVRNDAPYGPGPTGLLIYTREGRMSATISHAERRPLSVIDRTAAPPSERAEAFATFLAYAGRYTVVGDTVVHHVEVASVQNWVATDLVRSMALRGNQLILQNASASLGGQPQVFELVWERLPEKPPIRAAGRPTTR
jgi:hypothetical protein